MYTDRFGQTVTVGAKATFYYGSTLRDGHVERIIALVPHPRRAGVLCREDQLNRRDPTQFPAREPDKSFLAFMRVGDECWGVKAFAIQSQFLMLHPEI